MYRIESFLASRLFLSPQVVGERIYFISNLSGKLSLYSMRHGGSVPEPLIPPHIAMQNPHLVGGRPFYVFPMLQKILVMLDRDGDENYQPMFIPMDGGFPEPAFEETFERTQVFLMGCDQDLNICYLVAASRTEEVVRTYKANLQTRTLQEIASSPYGKYPAANNSDHTKIALVEGYSVGDGVLYLLEENQPQRVLYGIPWEDREEGQVVPLNSIGNIHFLEDTNTLVMTSSVFEDTYSPVLLNMDQPGQLIPVTMKGLIHQGVGELVSMEHLIDNRFSLEFNIDGCSWLYEAELDPIHKEFSIIQVLVGEAELANGVLFSSDYDKITDQFSFSFSNAVAPTQIYTLKRTGKSVLERHTNEKVLGIPVHLLSTGEDASFISHDGTRVSARLYLPSDDLGYSGKLPLVYYIHGGPQSQERPDFAWFSMPIIQFLTLNGFAVFVPNVRGSTGYGLNYTKQVDRDWGGQDRLDHVHALKVLTDHPRVDTNRAGVVGRSYGGYMTLVQAFRHPNLWKAAVDMFGPFDLLTFLQRIPETWKPYYRIALGDVDKDREFLVERSPKTYVDQLACPLLVIQGKNDPRVVEQESRDLVEHLRAQGKTVDYLMFENEGHDVLKYENRVRCYNAITDFFRKHLMEE